MFHYGLNVYAADCELVQTISCMWHVKNKSPFSSFEVKETLWHMTIVLMLPSTQLQSGNNIMR